MCTNNVYYGGNQIPPVDPEFARLYNKNCLDIQKQAEVENIKNRAQADREWQKMCYRETRKENELAQHQEVVIDTSGEIYDITTNLNVASKKRRTVNFKVKKMTRVVSIDGDSGIWIFRFSVGGIEKCCVMDEKHIFDEKYVTRKLGACGGVIYASSTKLKREYVEQIMSRLMETSTETLTVMKHLGWTKHENGQFIFIEEEKKLWRNFLKKAK